MSSSVLKGDHHSFAVTVGDSTVKVAHFVTVAPWGQVRGPLIMRREDGSSIGIRKPDGAPFTAQELVAFPGQMHAQSTPMDEVELITYCQFLPMTESKQFGVAVQDRDRDEAETERVAYRLRGGFGLPDVVC